MRVSFVVTYVRLADFIDRERASIVAEWETFARSLGPAADGMTASALQDHADEILTAIVDDINSRQTAEEQSEKSQGRGEAQRLGGIGKLHAALRLESGFNVGQMVAEYRALRASVLRLWAERGADPLGVTRFNEAIDEALTEAVDRFTQTTEHYRDQSLGILSHDLRNPLSSIIVGSTLIMNSDTVDDGTVRIAARMLNSANRMNRMISDLLDFTRTRFGHQIPVTRVPMDLAPLCIQVVAELEAFRPQGNLTYVGKGNLRGDWDSDRIAQVLSNLVRNAIQHGAKDAPIELIASDEGDDVHLQIHNSGPVIPEAHIKSMFEPMVRHADGDQTNPGLGLGLYIASQVVIAHGGSLDVTSTADDGTRFTVRLPRHAPRERPSMRAPKP